MSVNWQPNNMKGVSANKMVSSHCSWPWTNQGLVPFAVQSLSFNHLTGQIDVTLRNKLRGLYFLAIYWSHLLFPEQLSPACHILRSNQCINEGKLIIWPFLPCISYSRGMQPFPAFYLVIIEEYSNNDMVRLRAKAVVINLGCTEKNHLWSSVGEWGRRILIFYYRCLALKPK